MALPKSVVDSDEEGTGRSHLEASDDEPVEKPGSTKANRPVPISVDNTGDETGSPTNPPAKKLALTPVEFSDNDISDGSADIIHIPRRAKRPVPLPTAATTTTTPMSDTAALPHLTRPMPPPHSIPPDGGPTQLANNVNDRFGTMSRNLTLLSAQVAALTMKHTGLNETIKAAAGARDELHMELATFKTRLEELVKAQMHELLGPLIGHLEEEHRLLTEERAAMRRDQAKMQSVMAQLSKSLADQDT